MSLAPYHDYSAEALLVALQQAGRAPSLELIGACLERRDELTPGLLALLDRPREADWPNDDPRWYAAAHAGMLLATFREPAALPLFGQLYRRDESEVVDWSEWFDEQLLHYGEQALPLLSDLLLDKNVSDMAHTSAASMLTSIAAHDPTTRPAVVAALQAVLPPLDDSGQPVVTEAQRTEPPEIWTWAAMGLADLRDTTSEPTIVALFEADLLYNDIMGELEQYRAHLAGTDNQRAWLVSKPVDIIATYQELHEIDAWDKRQQAYATEIAARRSQAQQQAAEQRKRPTASTTTTSQTYVRAEPKIGRNEPCPCGSGRKYKHCHGKTNRVE